MATDLGKAYVQIMPSAKGISGSIQKVINPEATSAGKSAGKSIASAIGNSLSGLGDTLTKKVTKPALGAFTAVTGLVGALGFKRLIGMDNARAKLTGMGYEGERLEKVMNDARAAVTGTTMTMAEGVDIASGALAAGIKQGADLERYIKLVGSAAVGANRPVSDMAMIFNRVQGAGKLMTQELNMIEMGMPGFAQAMADNLANGSMETFRKMVTNGKVGSKEFLEVMDDFAGGMADAYAGTWSGMAKNVMSNIGIIGESLIGGLFEDGKKGMAEFLNVLRSDDLRTWAKETGEKIREVVLTVFDKVKELKGMWDNLSPSMQEVIKKITLFGGLGLVALGPILKIIVPIVSGIGALIPVLSALFSPVGLITAAIALLTAGLVHLWNTNEDFRSFVSELWDGIKEMFSVTIGAIVGFIKEVWGGLVAWWTENNEMIMQAFDNLVSFVTGLMEFLWPYIKIIVIETWNAIKGAIEGAIKIITGIIQFFAALFTGNWSSMWDAVKRIFSGAIQFVVNFVQISLVGRVLKIGKSLLTGFTGIIRNLWTSVTNLFKGGINNAYTTVTGFFGKFKNAGRNIVTSIADGIKGAIGKVTDAIKGVTQKVRDFLPFSPPKTGPLIDIMDVKWGETIAGGIEKGDSIVSKAMDDLLSFDLTKKARFSGSSYHPGHDNRVINITLDASNLDEVQNVLDLFAGIPQSVRRG